MKATTTCRAINIITKQNRPVNHHDWIECVNSWISNKEKNANDNFRHTTDLLTKGPERRVQIITQEGASKK